MKPALVRSPDVPFADPHLPPGLEDVVAAIGSRPYQPVAQVDAWVDVKHPNAGTEWRFSATAGWYRIRTVANRRLFYLVPKRGDFRLNVVLGYRAIASLARTPHGGTVTALLAQSQRYTEGTLFAFDRRTINPDLVIALLQAKLHT